MADIDADSSDAGRKARARFLAAADKAVVASTAALRSDLDIAVHIFKTRIMPVQISPSVAAESTIALVQAALAILGSMVYAVAEPTWVVRLVLPLWTNIWAWSDLLLSRSVQNQVWQHDGTEQHALRILGAVYRVLCLMSFDDAARTAVAFTPGVIDSVAHYWYLQEACTQTDIRYIGSFADILLRLLAAKQDLSDMVQSVGDCRALAGTMHGSLRRARVDPTVSPYTLYACLKLIDLVCEDTDVTRGVHPHLLRPGLSDEVLRCLARLGTQRYLSLEPSLLAHSIGAGFNIISHVSEHEGPTAMAKVIRHGFIRAIIDACRLDKGKTHTYLAYLRNVVGPFLCYRSVIKAASVDVSRVSLSDMTGCFRSDDWTIWNDFRQFVQCRVVHKQQFDKDFLATCYACRQRSCSGRELRQCSGCKGARYCSRYCQKQDWTRHKSDCTFHWRSRTFEGLNVRDREFVRMLSVAMLVERGPQLTAALGSQYSAVPLTDIVFKLDLGHTGDDPIQITHVDADAGWVEIQKRGEARSIVSDQALTRVQTTIVVPLGRYHSALLRNSVPCPTIRHPRESVDKYALPRHHETPT